ncbi:uncharacterized protein [Panulirus ornatus]|uniref:uncharacterized protein n=1 Tax=Panulirus ornatus TaxID=150431 RepID=UPI003A8ADE51
MSDDLLPCGDLGDDEDEPGGEEDDPTVSFRPPEVTLLSGGVQSPPLLPPAGPPLPTGSPLPPSPPLLTGSPSPPSPPLLTGSPLPPSPLLLTGLPSPPCPLLLTESPLPPSPPLLTPSQPSPPLLMGSLPESRSSPCLLADSPPTSSLSALPSNSSLLAGLLPCQPQYYNLSPQPAEDEVELARHLESQDICDPPPSRACSSIRKSVSGGGGGGGFNIGCGGGGDERWWAPRGVPGSLPSLTEPDSPPTASIDLEWEPEAGLGRVSRESLGEEEASQTADSSSWVPRSACSTPNSLEWDFRASTLSLRGGVEDETWQHTDMETEQLIHEIEQLTARALADTGHGLQPAPR